MPTDLAEDTRTLGQLIEDRAVEIEERWFQRACADLVGREGVSLTCLRDAMPDYLALLAKSLRGNSEPKRRGSSWADVAREHGVTRVRVGFDIRQLIREFVALRKVIEEAAMPIGALTTQSAICLADLIDAAIAESVSAYVEQRDYEARARQAEGIGFLIHELRNPLASADAATELVRASAVPAQHRAIEVLHRVHKELESLIDGVLLTSKLDAGKLEPKYADVRVSELVAAATAQARQVAEKKGLAFTLRIDDDRLVVLADFDLTRSALQNLVDNAVKYTDDGSVDIRVEHDDAAWTAHVRDTGPGLSPPEMRTIFEPFVRGWTTKKGTGLGLAIARRAIEAQGGSLSVESPGESGSHFWFELPRRPQD
jgi:signal transduction histidine kinase